MFDGFHSGMGAGGWVLMSLFWTALLAMLVWAITRTLPGRGNQARESPPSPDGPLEILDRRLASGEIDVQTYEQLRSTLSSRPAAGTG
jgi:putative membrane protein